MQSDVKNSLIKFQQVIFAILFGLGILGCESISGSSSKVATQEQIERKVRSEQLLKSQSLPINENLPVIFVDESSLQPELDVEMRAMCLLAVAAKAEFIPKQVIDSIIRTYGLEDYLTPAEREYLSKTEHVHDEHDDHEHDNSNFEKGQNLTDESARWRYESAWALFWALGLVETLDTPVDYAPVREMVRVMTRMNAAAYFEDAKLRPAKEILEAADQNYRYHWALHNMPKKPSKDMPWLNDGVTFERHYALHWLTKQNDENWDDVDIEFDDHEHAD